MPITTIRDFEIGDFAEVVKEWHCTNLQSYWYCEEHQRHSLTDAEEHFAQVVLNTCRVFVAEHDGKRAGIMALEDPWIRQLTVFPAFQRRGIGRALLDKAKEVSAAELRLFTFQRNDAARAFYEAEGFVPVAFGISPAPECEPDVEYRWLRPLIRQEPSMPSYKEQR